MITEYEVLQFLRAATRGNSVRAYARYLNVPQQTLAAALLGTRPIGDAILEAIGLRREIRYIRQRSPRTRVRYERIPRRQRRG